MKCVCDCGNTTLVLRTDLLKGKHVSCGRCSKWEVCEYLNNKCYKCTVLSGSFFIIDFDQYEKVSNKLWYDNGSGYFYTCLGNKKISLHRFLTNCPSGMVVDHVNHLKYDNTMKNLRVCTQAENMRNKSPEYISEFVGIRKRKNRYSARICMHSKEIHVGTYDTIEEAIAARKKKLDELLISEERICA